MICADADAGASKAMDLPVSLPAPEALRREIHDVLNVVENWNSANRFIFYGKRGEISTNQRDEQELAVLSLHLLWSSLVDINTLMLQGVGAQC